MVQGGVLRGQRLNLFLFQETFRCLNPYHTSLLQAVTQRTSAPKDLATGREQVPSFMPSEGAQCATCTALLRFCCKKRVSKMLLTTVKPIVVYCSAWATLLVTFISTAFFLALCTTL